MKRILIVILVLFSVLLVACQSQEPNNQEYVEENWPIQDEVQTLEDGTKYLLHPSKMLDGGPGKGGIGSGKGIVALDRPKFETATQADKWLDPEEPVMALIYKGEPRAYPLQIMTWHEIVNDNIQGDPILISFCPLCSCTYAHKRTITINGNNTTTRFGVSGKLYNSNLIMYDEASNTHWQQIGGRAILGEHTGQILEEIEVNTVTWKEWKTKYPETKVLSKETDLENCPFGRCYGESPYGNYEENLKLFFPIENENDQIHPKEIIYGIEIDDKFKAYREKDLTTTSPLQDEFNGIKIEIQKNNVGEVTFRNLQSGKVIPKQRQMWFSWFAFHPLTKLHGVELQ